MSEPNIPTNDDFLAVNKALDEAIVPASNRWGINERGETVQITDEYGEPVPSSTPNTDTLDEQIRELLQDYNGYDFCGEGSCSGHNKALELVNELKNLFTEHSKQQVDEALRIAKGRVKTASYQQMTDSSIDWAFATNEKPLEENNQTYGKHTIPNDWEKLDGVWIWFEAFHKGVHWQGIQGFVYKRPDGTFIAPFRGKLLEVIHDTKNEYREVAQLSKSNKGEDNE